MPWSEGYSTELNSAEAAVELVVLAFPGVPPHEEAEPMPLQSGSPAPYTTTAALTILLDAYRDRGLGSPVTTEVVARAGVQESLARRTVQALKQLGLIDSETGKPTEQWEAFRSARGQDEYETRLQEWLRGVYADVLQYADP